MSGSSCVIFVPDDTAKTGLPEPLMLRRVAGAPLLYFLAHDLADDGVRRVFLVCHERCLPAARACFPDDVELTVSGGDPADLLHVFLSTDEEEPESLLFITGPAIRAEEAPEGIDARRLPTCALSVQTEALMQALDLDFNFADFLRENGRVADAQSGLFSVTSAAELQRWQLPLRLRILERHAAVGVEIPDPASCFVEPTVHIGAGTVLLPGTILRGQTVVGGGCTVGPNALLEDAKVGDETVVNASQLRESVVGRGCLIGPWANLHGGTKIGDRAEIGSFVEIEGSTLGAGVKIPRLCYVGDAEIGAGAQLGCGTVTVNNDRAQIHHTVIGEEAFLGAGTQLIAPVTVGPGSYTAAGSTITEDVPGNALGIARTKLVIKKDWAEKHKKKE